MLTALRYSAAFGVLLALQASAEPVTVRHVQGFLHGLLVLKDLDGKLLASGDMVQLPQGNHVTAKLTLHFRDGSLYEETSEFSQDRAFRLLRYKQVEQGPSFSTQQTLSLDHSGVVDIRYTDKDHRQKTIADRMSLPDDLANGIVTMLLSEVDPKAEITLSMLVATPKPRVVKLRISALGQDPYSVGGLAAKATHFVVKIDLGGVTGALAKLVGKQPPPVDVWVAAGSAPVFLKSEGPLFEDGPPWRIELASPAWPGHVAAKH